MMKKYILLLIPVIAAGCSSSANHITGPDFQMSCTAEGCRAYGDYQNGMLKTAKESPDKPNQHMQFRKAEESEITKRQTAPSFLGGLFSSSDKDQNTNGGN